VGQPRPHPCSAIAEIAEAAWDALQPARDPFTAHRYLRLLEESGSVRAETGWQPFHLVLGAPAAPAGAVPLYLKSHSWGEYVFDHGWAEAQARLGGRYYPKLQAAVPFTPVSGPRLLAPQTLRPGIIRALEGLCAELGLSSVHVTFCEEGEADLFAQAGWLIRRGIRYCWFNRGYRDFEDFLEGLRSRRRKTIRRERRELRRSKLEIEVRSGEELDPCELERFHPLYLGTVDRRWGAAYLTPSFFRLLGERMRDRLVWVRAREHGRLVAAALHLLDDDTLYGRWWGSLEEYRFLHFECCYYRAMEFAIARGIGRVDAGIQGEHKLLRGYEPVWHWSAHHLRDRRLRALVARALAREQLLLEAERARMRELLPYAARLEEAPMRKRTASSSAAQSAASS